MNHKTSCVVDHANSDQHRAAMNHVRKASGTPTEKYSPIARGLLNMDKATEDRINIVIIIINIIDVRPCPNKTSVGLTHCQINL